MNMSKQITCIVPNVCQKTCKTNARGYKIKAQILNKKIKYQSQIYENFIVTRSRKSAPNVKVRRDYIMDFPPTKCQISLSLFGSRENYKNERKQSQATIILKNKAKHAMKSQLSLPIIFSRIDEKIGHAKTLEPTQSNRAFDLT